MHQRTYVVPQYRSPADRLPTAVRPPAEVDCRRPQPIPVKVQRPSREAGAFAVKGILSEPMARRSEIGCSTPQL